MKTKISQSGSCSENNQKGFGVNSLKSKVKPCRHIKGSASLTESRARSPVAALRSLAKRRRRAQILLLHKTGSLLVKSVALCVQKNNQNRMYTETFTCTRVLSTRSDHRTHCNILCYFTSRLSRMAASVKACRSLSKVLL